MINIPACTLVVAPLAGRVTRTSIDGTPVEAGDEVAALELDGLSHLVVAPNRGRVSGTLAGTGQRVVAGEPIVWLAPA